jgi:hypothetical protein
MNDKKTENDMKFGNYLQLCVSSPLWLVSPFQRWTLTKSCRTEETDLGLSLEPSLIKTFEPGVFISTVHPL